jgi:isochorismate synthase EntC
VINQTIAFLQSGAILSLPSGNILVGWGTPQASSTLNATDLSFFVSDFFLKQTEPWLSYPQWKEYTPDELLSLFTASPASAITWQIQHKNLFDQTFYEIQQAFQAGRLEKAVPYVFAESWEQMSPSRLQNSLIQGIDSFSKQAGYLYGCWHANEGFLGVTPEFLFKHQAYETPQWLQTMALAGTCRSSDSLEAFQTNHKECEEHTIVVEGIQQALQALGKVEIGPREVLKLPGLYHLMTPIKIHLHETFDFKRLVNQLHPTPALGAFPRLAGQQWLIHYNQHLERKVFGAPFGGYYPLKGLSFCVVGIRQVQWNLEGMRMGAGCGIVKESDVQQEWQEIQLKLKTIQQLVAL